jgi:hypothetical protein
MKYRNICQSMGIANEIFIEIGYEGVRISGR